MAELFLFARVKNEFNHHGDLFRAIRYEIEDNLLGWILFQKMQLMDNKLPNLSQANLKKRFAKCLDGSIKFQ